MKAGVLAHADLGAEARMPAERARALVFDRLRILDELHRPRVPAGAAEHIRRKRGTREIQKERRLQRRLLYTLIEQVERRRVPVQRELERRSRRHPEPNLAAGEAHGVLIRIDIRLDHGHAPAHAKTLGRRRSRG